MTNATTRSIRGLFLETSAQILRLAGSPEIQLGINELIRSSKRVGTSWFVKNEFEHTYVKLLHYVQRAAEVLPDPHRPRRFSDLIEEIREVLPVFIPGGPNLFFSLANRWSAKYYNSLMTPMFIVNIAAGHSESLLKAFIKDEFFDCSSCGVWQGRGHCSCSPEPEISCKLQSTCIDKRDSFVASVRLLAMAKREESDWLSKNLELIVRKEGLPLLSLVGKHPNHFGDLIIFWEVPELWTILTRDHTFSILNEAHPRLSAVYKIRLPRKLSGKKCKVRTAAGVSIKGVLINYSAKGARVDLNGSTLRKGDKVALSAREFSAPREGTIAYRDPSNESSYGIRLPMKRPLY